MNGEFLGEDFTVGDEEGEPPEPVELVGTGGVDLADETPITRSVAEQAKAAIGEADLVLFVTDARAGITPGDEELAQILRNSRKAVLLIANKIDDPAQDIL